MLTIVPAYDEGTADCAGFGATPDLDAVRL